MEPVVSPMMLGPMGTGWAGLLGMRELDSDTAAPHQKQPMGSWPLVQHLRKRLTSPWEPAAFHTGSFQGENEGKSPVWVIDPPIIHLGD
jgi:hypothetical protein